MLDGSVLEKLLLESQKRAKEWDERQFPFLRLSPWQTLPSSSLTMVPAWGGGVGAVGTETPVAARLEQHIDCREVHVWTGFSILPTVGLTPTYAMHAAKVRCEG